MDTTGVQSKQRIQFDFTPEALKRLEDLKKRIEASTKAEVIRNALKLYEWFVQVDPSYIVEVKDEEGNIVFRIPAKLLLS
jgi:vesicle coat complex subunit